MAEEKNYTIRITPDIIVKTILIGLLFWFLFIVRDIVLVVLTSIVIASAVEPVTRFLGRFAVPRVLAVITSYLIFFGIATGFVYFFMPTIIDQTTQILSTVPKEVNWSSFWNPLSSTVSEQQVNTVAVQLAQSKEVVTGIPNELAIGGAGIIDLLGKVRQTFATFSGGFAQTLQTVFGGFLSFALIIVISFYLAVQENGIEKFLRLVLPLRHEKYVIGLWQRTQKKIGYWVQGQVFLGFFVGLILYLALSVAGVSNALLLATFAAFVEIIPIFGPILAAIPAIIIAYTDAGLGLAVVTMLIYVIVQQFENHLLYPLVVKKIIGVPPIVSILALVIGGKLAGFLGILLAVPVATALIEFLDDIQEDKITRQRETHA